MESTKLAESAGEVRCPDLERASSAEDAPDPWSQERLALLAELWGPGFTSPGGEEFAIELIKPLAPTSAMSLLNLDAHLGGSARTIANVYKMWVNAFEPDESLARIGMEMSEREGMVKRAPVEFCDREGLSERLTKDRRQYDCVFSKDGFYRVANKDALFEAIYKHLKQNGQFLFTDYVLPEGAEVSPEAVAGLASEKGEQHLWTVKQTLKSINRFEFEVHISEDMTDRYRGMIVRAWANYLVHLKQHSQLTPAMGEALLREVETWVRRVLAFDRGGLRIHRIHVVKRASDAF
ncbi:hypothetical protein JYT88_01835 [Rhodospirillaceae bacterium AH-315-P19]|nr:hypothetical protein [Rhodospirillaceae bacterium AH-315-P19]